ncbi:hypothetical protein BU26DRAFT_510174 [Trematosphaeria pertusa]|uniref:Uncharacterized protein n=1 Tax=Trematosphaeria pertusa TaxID=390896 RepID=A0A6A6HY39_9PLEO|nr:uncharacterized protein BU26DRAFT_510174 [Trematosphaeria pertusa]KAF2242961.1 hypothetical protein BU26DRAFT_510174 [Trematosphaeria pertusa]
MECYCEAGRAPVRMAADARVDSWAPPSQYSDVSHFVMGMGSECRIGDLRQPAIGRCTYRPWFRFNGAVELPCSFLEAAFQGSRSRQAYPRAVYEPECWWAPPLQSATGPLAATAAASGRASSAIASTPATAAGRRARLAANSAHSTPPAGWHDAWTLDTLPRRRPSEGSFEAE